MVKLYVSLWGVVGKSCILGKVALNVDKINIVLTLFRRSRMEVLNRILDF